MGKCMFLRKGETHTKPVTGILAADLAVGSTVKLMEGETAVEYLVVNQGKPAESSLYDDSCDGTWLLRKDVYSKRYWNDSNVSTYADSEINTYINKTFFNSLGSIEQATVTQVKIPYCVGGGSRKINSGTNGLSTKVFLLSGYEVGWTTDDRSGFPIDGVKLEYFDTSEAGNSKRIAYYDGSATYWWLRSPDTSSSSTIWDIIPSGNCENSGVSYLVGVRPALILPGDALFDETTMILKGAA